MPAKLTFEVVNARFIAEGYSLLEDAYTNSRRPMRYRCKCGNDECYLSTHDLKQGVVGCKLCSVKGRIATNIARYGVENPSQCPAIKAAKIATNVVTRGVEHPFQCPDVKVKMRETNLATRGVAFPTQCPEVRAKARVTNIAVRGVEYPSQCPEVQATIRATNLETRGVENPFQCPEVQAKTRETNLATLGVEHPMQCPEVQAKARETNLAIRGVEHPMQCPKVQAKSRATNLTVRGVEYPLQCPEVFARMLRSSFSLKPYTFPNGEIVQIQGYEHHCLNDLLREGVEQDDLILGYKQRPIIQYQIEESRHVYYPDIFIPSQNRIIEVKSDYTYDKAIERNTAKMEATALNHSAELRVYSGKGELLKRYTY
jgi:hypothetical protein